MTIQQRANEMRVEADTLILEAARLRDAADVLDGEPPRSQSQLSCPAQHLEVSLANASLSANGRS